jgi:hypothetical protein
MTCTNLIPSNIIDYCGTWYGINHGKFKAMFVDPTYLQVDSLQNFMGSRVNQLVIEHLNA